MGASRWQRLKRSPRGTNTFKLIGDLHGGVYLLDLNFTSAIVPFDVGTKKNEEM